MRTTNSDDNNNDTHFYEIILRFKCKALYSGKNNQNLPLPVNNSNNNDDEDDNFK